MLGHALVELGKADQDLARVSQGVKCLQKAYKLALEVGCKPDTLGLIQKKVRVARKIEFLKHLKG